MQGEFVRQIELFLQLYDAWVVDKIKQYSTGCG